ncbi:MAG: hypothetical protein U0165_00355 [Polyangiaceae bacterium]
MTRSIPVAEVISAARLGLAMVAAESAGYVILGAVDALLDAPVVVDPRAVLVSDEGTITVRSPIAATSEDAASSNRKLLKMLLGCVTSPTPALLGVASRSGGDLRQLVVELEAALVPVNRAAARRTLARLAREGLRALDQGVLGPRDKVAELAAAATTMDARPRAVRAPEPVHAAQPAAPAPVAPPAPAARPATRSPAPSRVAAQAAQLIETPTPRRPSLPPEALEPFPPPEHFGRYEVASSVKPAADIDDGPTPIDAAPVMDVAEPEVDPELAEATVQLPPKPAPAPDATDRLIAEFVTSDLEHGQLSASLKKLAGLEPTPPPPAIREPLFRAPPEPASDAREMRARPSAEDTRESLSALVSSPSPLATQTPAQAQTPGLEHLTRTPRSEPSPRRAELPMLDDDSFGLRPITPRSQAPKLSLAVLFVLLLGGIAATLGVWVEHPEFFAGKNSLSVPR